MSMRQKQRAAPMNVSVRLDMATYRRLVKVAKEQDRTLSAQLRRFIAAGLDESA